MNEFGDEMLKDTYHLLLELQFILSSLSPTVCIHIGKDKEVIYHTLGILFYLFFPFFLGCMTILPTILFLITRVLKETAVKSADNQVPPPVTAALQGIKTIVTLPTVKTDETQKQWTGLIRSTLASILEDSQPGKWFSSV